MKQLVYLEPRRLEWRDAPTPKIASDADALVRPIAVTRCDLDRHIANGALGWKGPFAVGHETYGEVIDVGEHVRNFRPGDRAIVPFQISCGQCGRCLRGLTGLCESVPYRSSYGMAPLSGVEYGGGLSDLMLVPYADHMLVPAPADLSPDALAGVADNLTSAVCFVADPLRQTPGAPVLVVAGRGRGVGLHIVQCAIAYGSNRVCYVDDDERALELASQAGAEAHRLQIAADTKPIGIFPITIDTSGSEEGLAFALRSTEYEGLCQRAYGDFTPTTRVPLNEMYGRNLTLKLGRVHARAHMHETLRLMQHRGLHPERVITRRVPFADAAEAILEPEIKIVFTRD